MFTHKRPDSKLYLHSYRYIDFFFKKSIWLELRNRKQVNLPDFISFRKNEDTHEKDTLNYISESFTVFFTSDKSDMIPLSSLTPFQENNMPWFPKKSHIYNKLLLHKNILQIHVTHISYQHKSTVLCFEFGAKMAENVDSFCEDIVRYSGGNPNVLFHHCQFCK